MSRTNKYLIEDLKFCDEFISNRNMLNGDDRVHISNMLRRAIDALELAEQGAEIAELKGMLKVARCPNTNCSDGILYVGPEIEQCQWCYEASQFINPIGDEHETLSHTRHTS